MVAFGNPVEGFILGPNVTRRDDDPRLSTGHALFRVTQTFDHINTAISLLPHGAIDMANYICGDRVFAAKGGNARRYVDNAGALAVIIDHHDGWQTLYWHLSAWVIPTGTSTVLGGQHIGYVGKTGLGGSCHLHFEVHKNGKKVDPWPLLRQNGATEDDMTISGKFIKHIVNKRSTLKVQTNFRAGSSTKTEVVQLFPAKTGFYPVIEVENEIVNGSPTWYGCWLYVTGSGYTFGYLHSSLCTPLEEVELSGISADEMARRVEAATKAGFSKAVTKAVAAVSAIKQ